MFFDTVDALSLDQYLDIRCFNADLSSVKICRINFSYDSCNRLLPSPVSWHLLPPVYPKENVFYIAGLGVAHDWADDDVIFTLNVICLFTHLVWLWLFHTKHSPPLISYLAYKKKRHFVGGAGA